MAQLNAQDLLRMAEKSGELCFFDLESTNLKGTYGSVLCVAIKPFDKPAKLFSVQHPGLDRTVVREASRELEKYTVWVSYYGRGFDVPMLRTRALIGRVTPLSSRHHLDLYFSVVASKMNTARKSQAHVLEALYPNGHSKERKMSVSPEEWNKVLNETTRGSAMKIMGKRCISDTVGLESLYKRVKHVVVEVNK